MYGESFNSESDSNGADGAIINDMEKDIVSFVLFTGSIDANL